ncbi:MAG: hypothetical protein GWN97_14680, partial [Thermoplasmata archaeon]|nr:hypothetical protein [Thermoplasmata archaeon]NIS13113.1 hypothetical protein [Thermoplasmata archaeon]
SVSNVGGDSYEGTFTANPYYISADDPTEYGNLEVDILASAIGTDLTIPLGVGGSTFVDVWESQAAPECIQFPDIDGDGGWQYDSYQEGYGASSTGYNGQDTSAIKITFDWVQDSFPTESDIYIESPDGTVVFLGPAGVNKFDPETDGAYSIILTDFAGESPIGTWIVSETDTFGDGGGDV